MLATNSGNRFKDLSKVCLLYVSGLKEARIIRIKKLTYIWDSDKTTFIKLAGLDKGISKQELHSFKGQSKNEQNLR